MSAIAALAARPITFRVSHARFAVQSAVFGALALALAPRFLAAGSPMDEGGVLTYADRILAGEVPARDLHSFYGPLSTYLVAGVFKVAGPSLYAERAVGFGYRLVLVGALLALVRRRRAPATLAAGGLLVLLLPSQGVAAFATYGALACSCTAIALADVRRPFLAGLAAGAALLMRFDWALPILLAAIPFLLSWPWRARFRSFAGAVLGAFAYVPYLAVVGPAKVRLWVEQLRSGQSGRRLPLPSWSGGTGHLLALAVVAIVVLAAVGLHRRRGEEGLIFLSVALLGAGLLPYALLRPDRSHVLVAALAPVTLFSAAIPAALEEFGRARRLITVALGTAALSYAVFVVLVERNYAPVLSTDVVGSSLDATNSFAVVHDGRSFRVSDPGVALSAQSAVERADAVAPAGGRLFVGPGDLRRTDYSDAYIYFLLPRLQPATFYITLDPGSTETRGVSLANELERASVLILNAAYNDPLERNARAEAYGSNAPNRIVARDFCLRGTYGTFRVYARCGNV